MALSGYSWWTGTLEPDELFVDRDPHLVERSKLIVSRPMKAYKYKRETNVEFPFLRFGLLSGYELRWDQGRVTELTIWETWVGTAAMQMILAI